MTLNFCFIKFQIRNIWKKKPDEISCNIEQMANHLNISSRTLQRRLKDEGTCYLTLQDSARLDLTLNLFSSGRNVEEVSEALGFSDRRCFTRAFKRWTGESPKAHKKTCVKT
jgi:AraC-like DNA-binding protein